MAEQLTEKTLGEGFAFFHWQSLRWRGMESAACFGFGFTACRRCLSTWHFIQTGSYNYG